MASRQSKHRFAVQVGIVVSVLALAGTWMSARRFHQRAMPPPIEQSRNEPIRYVGERQTDKRYYHGGLRSAVGVHRYQVFRANREHPLEGGSAPGWTYSHQPYLAYWNGKFYLQYLSKEKAEYLPPARTLILTSEDGRRWSGPEVVFPEYTLPAFRFKDPRTGRSYDITAGMKSVMHHRAGFYVTRPGRLLTFGFYGVCPSPKFAPNNATREDPRCRLRQGLGRVVREIHADGTYGPIYFIRYNRLEGWTGSKTQYPFYRESPDIGFVKACEEVLENKLITLQWSEDDGATDGDDAFRPTDLERRAFSFYRRPDGVVVGVWKDQVTALSPDEGHTWTNLARASTLMTRGSKVWGQRTEDGRYALVYNHSATLRNRFPLVVMTGDDGYRFGDMLALEGEVPPMRYYGWAKTQGPQYLRGIIEGNGDPPGNHMWTTYSMNKEDIWVSRTRVPIAGVVSEHVGETFDQVESEADLALWNLYIPAWAPIEVITADGNGRLLQLRDHDPYDYALAERAFPASGRGSVEFRVFLKAMGKDILEFELVSDRSERAVRLRFDSAHGGLTFDLADVEPEPVPFSAGQWHQVKLAFDSRQGWYDVWVDGQQVKARVELAIKGTTLERMVFRTGSWRGDVRLLFLDGEPSAPGLDSEDLPAAGEKVAESVFWIDDVKTTGK